MASETEKVPVNWQKIKFEEIAEIITDRIENPSESGLNDFIGLEHLDTDCIRIKRFGSADDVTSSKFICKKGDIIFSRRRTYLRKLAISDRDAVVSTDAMIFRPKGDKIYPDFLPCLMQSSIFWKAVHANSEGSMSPRIKWKTLAKQEFWIPSIEEQKKIIEIIRSIEENIEKTRQLIDLSERMKTDIFNEILTKGIGHTKFKDTDLGKIPEQWGAKKIREVDNSKGTVQTGPFGSILHSYDYSAEGVPLLLVKNIDDGELVNLNDIPKVNFEKARKLNKFCLEDGDIVFTRVGAVGRTLYITKDYEGWMFSGQTLRLRIKNKNINNKFISYYFRSQIFQNIMGCHILGSTRPSINTSILKNACIPIPSKEEQDIIVEILDNFVIFNSTPKKHIVQLTILKMKLLNELLSGKLRIPAEVLSSVQ